MQRLGEVGLLLHQFVAQASLQGHTVVALRLKGGHCRLILLLAGEAVVLQAGLDAVVRALKLFVLVVQNGGGVGTHLLQGVVHHLGIFIVVDQRVYFNVGNAQSL